MAIGDVSASGGIARATQSNRVSGVMETAAGNLDQSVQRFSRSVFQHLGSQQQIEKIYDNRAMASENLELETRFLQYQEENAKLYTDFARDRSETPIGMTNDFDAQLSEREKAFLATVPPRFQEEYKAKLAQDRAQRVGSTFRAELELMDSVDSRNLTTSLNTIGSALKGGTMDLDSAEEAWIESVSKSGLPEATKAAMIENGRATIQGLEFGSINEAAAKGYGVATNDYSGRDVVAAGLSPYQRGVLNAISDREAGAYNVWNGGSTFEGYADHPANLGLKAPGESTAAGRYQFVVGTWNVAKKSYEAKYGVKVPDFSPEWQDRVALHWAEVQFNRRNKEGLNFNAVLASGDPAQIAKIRGALGNPSDPRNRNSVEWQGLGNAKDYGDAEFLAVVMGERGVAGGGTGAPQMPNVWTDPRFTHVSLEDKIKYSNAATAAAEQFKLDQSETIKNEMKKFQDQMWAIGYSGAGLDGMEQFKSSPYWNADAEKRYREGVTAFGEKEVSIAEVERMRTEGRPMDPNNPKQMKAYGQWFGAETVNGISTGEAWAYDKLRGATERFGVMPTDARTALQAAMANPDTRFSALEFLASLHAGDPSVLFKSGFSDKDLANAILYKGLAAGNSPSEAQEKYNAIQENIEKLGMNPGKAAEEAQKYFNENITTDNLVRSISTFGQYYNPSTDTTLNPSFERQLLLDGAEHFKLGYMLTGTADGAQEYMETVLNEMYGVSYTNNNMIIPGLGEVPEATTLTPVPMKYPPEKYYPAAAGEHEYIYRAMDSFVTGNLPPGTVVRPGTAVLISDAETEQQIRNGEPPTYKMIAQDEFGGLLLIPDRFGGTYLQDAAETINDYESIRLVAREEMIGAEQTVLELEDRLEALRGLDLTPEELALQEATQADLDLARRRLAGTQTGAAELGVAPASAPGLVPEGQVLADRALEFQESQTRAGRREELVAEGTQKVMDLRNDPAEWTMFSKRLGAMAQTLVIKGERNGSPVALPEARVKAASTLLQKDFAMVPEVADVVANELIFGPTSSVDPVVDEEALRDRFGPEVWDDMTEDERAKAVKEPAAAMIYYNLRKRYGG